LAAPRGPTRRRPLAVRVVASARPEPRGVEDNAVLSGSNIREERQEKVIADAVNPASMAELSNAGDATRRTEVVEGHVPIEKGAEGANMSVLTQPINSADRARQITEEVRGNLLLLAPLAPRQEGAMVKQSLKLLRLVLGLAPGCEAPVAVPRVGSADGR
jgi:hypothetical protein